MMFWAAPCGYAMALDKDGDHDRGLSAGGMTIIDQDCNPTLALMDDPSRMAIPWNLYTRAAGYEPDRGEAG